MLSQSSARVADPPNAIVLPALPEAATFTADASAGLLVPMSLEAGPAMLFALANTGSVAATGVQTTDTSDLAVRGDLARAATGLTGRGVRVGVLSDSFNLLGGAASDSARGDLPSQTTILKEGAPGGHDEGRAMADLVHRIAPGATIDFYSATGSEAQFASGIQALQAAGCKIIVDDVAYLDEPFFQDGSKLQVAVEQAINAGVSYFTAAGNEGANFYQHVFAPMQASLPGLPGIWTVANFGGNATHRGFVTLTIPNNTTCSIDLQWDQPFHSISGGAGATSSLALALYTSAGKLVGTAGTLAVGGDARQLLQFTNHTGGTSFRLVVLSNAAAPPPGQFKFVIYGSGSVADPQAGAGSGTVTGHELVAGVNTVGAMAWSSAPRFGGAGNVEAYSSVGPGQILFDAQGHRIATPGSDHKVSFVAPDGSQTSVFAPFYGTSAAAPNAAAVAALMLQADPLMTPAQVTSALERSAVPSHGLPGAAGSGLLQATTAVQLALALAHHA